MTVILFDIFKFVLRKSYELWCGIANRILHKLVKNEVSIEINA